MHLSGNPPATVSKHRATRRTGSAMTTPSGDFNRMGIVWIGRNPVAVPSRLRCLAQRESAQRVGCSSHPPQHNAPHGIGKPTANRDLTPLATANGYRPADGLGVVNQAWRPGKTGNPNNVSGHGRLVRLQPSKLARRVRFPWAAPNKNPAGSGRGRYSRRNKMHDDDTTISAFGEQADDLPQEMRGVAA